jgi:hypothetical protein
MWIVSQTYWNELPDDFKTGEPARKPFRSGGPECLHNQQPS